MGRVALGLWAFFVISWTILTVAFSVLINLSYSIFTHIIEIEQSEYNLEIANYLTSPLQYIEALAFGVSFGTAFFIVNHITEQTSISKLPLGKLIALKTILYTVALIISVGSVALFAYQSGLAPHGMIQEALMLGLHKRLIITVVIFILLASTLINFLAQVNKKIGPANLIPYFLGKYHNPVVEDRTFLFLDLSNSTQFAEQLGHIVYSKLIQDCFYDLNKIIPKYDAEIYQYVGDEAVLTWRNRKKIVAEKPVDLFFEFRNRLSKKAKYYSLTYGIMPQFKAGLNSGVVTTAEVGDIKREIAFHGAVLNTASRLRDMCSELHKPFLATERAIANLQHRKDLTIINMGEHQLKGKRSPERIFSIEKAESSYTILNQKVELMTQPGSRV